MWLVPTTQTGKARSAGPNPDRVLPQGGQAQRPGSDAGGWALALCAPGSRPGSPGTALGTLCAQGDRRLRHLKKPRRPTPEHTACGHSAGAAAGRKVQRARDSFIVRRGRRDALPGTPQRWESLPANSLTLCKCLPKRPFLPGKSMSTEPPPRDRGSLPNPVSPHPRAPPRN